MSSVSLNSCLRTDGDSEAPLTVTVIRENYGMNSDRMRERKRERERERDRTVNSAAWKCSVLVAWTTRRAIVTEPAKVKLVISGVI